MRKNVYLIMAMVTMLICLYMLFLRFPFVTYYGETENGRVELNAKLAGTEGSYEILFFFKGNEELDHLIFDVHPHFGVGWLSETTRNEEYVYQCEGCGYYDHDDELLMFIKWKEGSRKLEYESELFSLVKK
ncbi:hypothetical protein [Halalkalibacter alkalisediminis]|uniref:Uncharacterized protein n=1 Tax=Halalkalibacter alkalisediminis TaxID=935616 RepID=A0ABV6NNS3_9BACI|nr:hypothetical protein [Halalkalibacter alkalisediminis]